LQVLSFQAWPNPDPNAFAVQLDGAADEIEIRIYTQAETCVGVFRGSSAQAGWNQVPLPVGWANDLAHGLYFARSTARRGSLISPPVRATKMVLLR
jgi:hypothetical protein